ncbi:serine hydrolase domain-containing protein [Ramlibacter sp.]|uniref:serine hydrolase domain-containing protein n=1 Tax=Ramlibacter sp. TaxID=1917967 RepID=UPI003D0CF7D3
MRTSRRAALLAAISGVAGVAGVAPAFAKPASLQDFLDSFVQRQKLPGAVLRITGPRGTAEAVAGVAEVQRREPVTPRTRFYIASAGKLATAAAVLQMVEEGKLRLNEPVYPLVRDTSGIRRLRNIHRVTLEQLLKHRSGLAEYYTDDFEKAAAAAPRKVFGAAESLAFAYDQEPESRPGREHSYTNTNYVVLGLVAEAVDQMPFARVLQRRIFDRLGMTATTVGAKAAERDLAHGYTAGARGRLADVSFSGWNAVTGDGALVSTASDCEKFILALMRDGKVLPRPAVARMCRVQAEEPESGYGLGCTIDDTPWGEAWGHNGSIPGFQADAWFLPKRRISVVFFANGDFEDEEAEVVVPAVRAYLKR